MPKHPTTEFGWQLRDLRLAFRRRDCEEARYIVQRMMATRSLSAAQRSTILKLQHAVRICQRKLPEDLGRVRVKAKKPRRRK